MVAALQDSKRSGERCGKWLHALFAGKSTWTPSQERAKRRRETSSGWSVNANKSRYLSIAALIPP